MVLQCFLCSLNQPREISDVRDGARDGAECKLFPCLGAGWTQKLCVLNSVATMRYATPFLNCYSI